MLTHRYDRLYPQLFFVPRAGGNLVQKRKLLLNDSLLQPSRAVPIDTRTRLELPKYPAGSGLLQIEKGLRPARWRKSSSKAQAAFERFPIPAVARGCHLVHE